MFSSNVSRSLMLGCLALAWRLAVSIAAAAPVSSEAKPKVEPPAHTIRQALDKTYNFEIDGQTLPLALSNLKDKFGVNLVLDRSSLQLMGIEPEQLPVSFKGKNVKLRSALRSILGQYNLSFAIVEDSVLVTTDEMAMYRQMRQRVNVDYDNTEFARAIKQLARDTATNLVIDARSAKEAKTAVTLQLEDVPLETAVRLMSEMVGLKPVRVGNVLFICSKTAAKELKADTDLVPPMPNSRPDLDGFALPPMARPLPGVPVLPPMMTPGAAPPPPPMGAPRTDPSMIPPRPPTRAN